MAKRQVKRSPETKKAYVEWTDQEDELVMNSDLPDKEIARQLQRSIASIHNRRYVLRNRKGGANE